MKKKSRPKRKSPMKGGRIDRWLVPGVLIALVVIALVLWGPMRKFRAPEEKSEPQIEKPEPARRKPEALPKEKQRREQREGTAVAPGPEKKAALIAIVIDDMGQDIRKAREILSLPGAVTLSIMPGLRHTRQTAELAIQNNREVLLHLPMEYRGKKGNPAPGMLFSNMTPDKFLATVNSDIEAVPGAIGINNHEGSALTENREAMKFLMSNLRDRGLMFLDSMTTSKSVAYATARKFGIRTAKRDVFLDNERNNHAYIRNQFEILTEYALKHGKAIGIGHPHAATISELRKWLAGTESRGIEIVPVSKLMN